MSFETTNEAITEGRTLYTGWTNVNILCCNPTNAEMEKLGLNIKNKDIEPSYYSEKNNLRIVKFLFDCKLENGDVIKSDVPLFIGASGYKSAKGLVQYSDKFGRFKWIAVEDDGTPILSNIQYFDTNSMELAYTGEEYLTLFMKNLLNINADKECRLDNIKSLYENGDYSEIKSLLKTFNNKNVIGVQLGVRTSSEGKYFQTVYTKAFNRSWSKNNDKMAEKLTIDIKGGYTKDVYYGHPPYNLTKFDKSLLDVTSSSGMIPTTVNSSTPF